MADGTIGLAQDSAEKHALESSGNDNYNRNEAERAQNDLAHRAIQYAKGCGAEVPWPPPSDLTGILRSDFWFFVYNAAVHRHTFEGPAHRVEDIKRKLSDLVKAMLPLVELLRDEPYARALGALSFENWLVQRHSQAPPISGEKVAERTHQCLELLLGPLEHAFERSKAKSSTTDRHKLIRWALEQPETSGGWWPSNPTEEDLTALSVLTGVYLGNFEDDFDERQELAEHPESASAPDSHSQALWRRERKRWVDLRKTLGERHH